MNRTAKQLVDYVPQCVSLYYVDYRDDLDGHEDIQEECIRSNSLEKLYEKAYEWSWGTGKLKHARLPGGNKEKHGSGQPCWTV